MKNDIKQVVRQGYRPLVFYQFFYLFSNIQKSLFTSSSSSPYLIMTVCWVFYIIMFQHFFLLQLLNTKLEQNCFLHKIGVDEKSDKKWLKKEDVQSRNWCFSHLLWSFICNSIISSWTLIKACVHYVLSNFYFFIKW